MLPCSRNSTVNFNVYFQCLCYYRVVKLSWNNHPLFTVWAAQLTCPRTRALHFPAAHSSTNKWEFTLTPHAVAMTGTGGSAREHFWPRATSALHTQKTLQVPPLSLSSTHPFLGAVLTLQGMNFPNQPGSSSPVHFSFPAVTPVCLTYRQQSHLSPSSSPAHPTAEQEWITWQDTLKHKQCYPKEMPSTNLSDGPALQFKTKNFYLVMGH